MKKIFLLISFACLSLGANAQNADELRIYINPGHGSWGPNDRPMATIPYPNLPETGRPDTLGFYESNTNLWKALQLGETLERMGVKKENIMYSRKFNGPYPYVKGAPDAEIYNRNLSEICAEVDANNMDMFISIHSNAAADGTATNFPLILYRGKDGEGNDYAAGSYNMSKACWPRHYMNEIDPHTAYSKTQPNIRGDITFYGSSSVRVDPVTGISYEGYLGVLKHGTPGFLLEGFFHTYQPARHRALNKDYCYQEGVRIARGICDYYNLTPEKTGYIMGTVKDMHEKIVNNLFKYASGSNDQWLPLNGAKVHLLKNGTNVATYQVDSLYNGLFVFKNVEPGDYTVEVEAEGYKPLTDEYKVPITVKANETSYATLLVESESYVPPVIVYQNYPDPIQPAYLGVPNEFNLRQESTEYAFEGTLKRAIVRGDSTVVLTEKEGVPILYLVNTATKQIVKNISVEGIAENSGLGGYSRLSDIAFTADGKLVGINSVLCQFGNEQVDEGYTRGTLRLYKWDSFDVNPTEWVTTQNSANFYRAVMGKTLAISGEAKDCNIITTATTTGSSKGTRMLVINVVDNVIASTIFTEKTITNGNFTELKQGSNFQLTTSPLADDKFVLDGGLTLPLEFNPADVQNTDSEITGIFPENADAMNKLDMGISFFKYAKHALMVAPYTVDGAVTGVKLYDVTNGLNQAKLIKTTTTVLTTPVSAANGSDTTPFMAAGAKVNGANITLYLVANNAITKFTTEGVEQPKVKGIMAYGLSQTVENDKSYTFKFCVNDTPTAAKLIFTDATSGETVAEVDVPNAIHGENSINLSQAELPGVDGQQMNWAVQVAGQPIANIVRLNPLDATTTYSTTFCVVDKSPESDYFGRVYASNYINGNDVTKGLYVYTPDWNRVNNTAYQGGQTLGTNYRLGIDMAGTLYMADWGDATSAVYIINPANPEGTFGSFFVGSRNSDGLITNDGQTVGSSSPGIYVAGQGADTKLYIYLEDVGKDVGRYDIGNPDGTLQTTWDKAPSKMMGVGSLQANGNGNIVGGPDGGIWIAQTRGSGNNLKGVPSLIYVTSEGQVVFNSGADDFADKLNGSTGSGFAVSNDGKTLVINDGLGVLQFFDLTWNAGVPTLTPKYSYVADAKSARNYINQMVFDYAGNLICAGGNLGIYSMPTDDNRTTTPAKKSLLVVKGDPTGIEDVMVEQGVSIYPNPTEGMIHITCSEPIKTVLVYNTHGMLVARGNSENVDLSHLTAGVYLVKVNQLKAVRIIRR